LIDEINGVDEVDEIYSRVSALSAREFEVHRLVATGMTNFSIGMDLGISERTVREHISRIMLKLGVGSRVEIAVIATKWTLFGLVRRGEFGKSNEASYGSYPARVRELWAYVIRGICRPSAGT
jgi:DNA-binding CsgD family transcriptional regulator